MRVISALIAVFATASCFPQDGWKRPDNTQIRFLERIADLPEREITICQDPTSVAIKTRAGINGELEGVPRVELLNSLGIFTWIQGSPRTVLQLVVPTSLDSLDYMSRPQFSRADLEFNLQGIERALGKRVLVGKSETVAGRNCLAIFVLERPDSIGSDYQELWIDRETGLTLQQKDYYAGQLAYQRVAIDLKFELDLPSENRIDSDALVIRGPVGASILQKLSSPKSFSEFKTDIERINGSKSAPAQNWSGYLETANPFAYINTNYRELVAAKPAQSNNSRRNQGQRGNQLTDFRQLMQSGNTQMQVTRNPDGSRTVNLVTQSNGQTQEYQINQGQNGQIQMVQTGGSPATTTTTRPNQPKTFYVAESEFVDPKTGQILVLLQVYGAPAEGYLGPLPLGTKEILKDQKLSNAGFYSVLSPFPLRILTWQKGEVRLALCSNGLKAEEMVLLASKLK